MSNPLDYLPIVLNAAMVILNLLIVIIAFRSFRGTSRHSKAVLEESRRQSEAALQVAKMSMQASLDTIEEMREARDQESAPSVIAFFDLLGDSHIFFVVKNIGRSVATDIKLTVEPPFTPISTYSKLNDLPLIQNGIAALAPGSEIRALFIVSVHFGEALNACPTYKATIEYKGGLSLKQRKEEMFLDLSIYENIIPNHKKDLDDLVKEVERIKDTFKSLNSTVKEMAQTLEDGLWIKNPVMLSLNLDLEDTTCLSFIGTKLQEFQTKWQTEYGRKLYRVSDEEDSKRLVNPHDTDTRHECMLAGQQVLFALAKCQASLPRELTEKIIHAATALLTLGKMDVYGYGENSFEAFHKIGEETSKEIEDISSLIKDHVDQPSKTSSHGTMSTQEFSA